MKKREDVVEIIKIVSIVVEFKISKVMIDACHRLGKRQDTITHSGITVKFARRLDTEETGQTGLVYERNGTRFRLSING